MAFITDKPQEKYSYQKFPLVVHRGEHPNIQSKQVWSEDELAEHIEAGWSTERPFMPEPEEPKAPLTLEERVAALEEKVSALTPKRGRPKKDASDE